MAQRKHLCKERFNYVYIVYFRDRLIGAHKMNDDEDNWEAAFYANRFQ